MPGFARSRKELFWLPYPEPDKVLINAHNFPSLGFDPSVNGKNPVAVWCPSRDAAGNGTTTLTDLIGTNPGTLVNFALSGSTSNWVADTGAGGSVAIAVDNTDDRIDSNFAIANGAYAISWWDKPTSSTVVQGRFEIAISGQSFPFAIVRLGVGGYQNLSFAQWAGVTSVGANVPTIASTVGAWNHWLVTGSSITSVTTSHHAVYVNGVLYSTVSSGAFSGIPGTTTRIGRNRANQNMNARFDDVRVFEQQLNGSDASALYAAGSGRGISA